MIASGRAIELRNPDKLNIRFMVQVHILLTELLAYREGKSGWVSRVFTALSTSLQQTSGETRSPNTQYVVLA
jgi:hypothetical protein